jgi:hypothetical protein
VKSFSSVEMTNLGVSGVLAPACIEQPWAVYVAGVRVAPMPAVLKQAAAVMTLAGSGTPTTPRNTDFARSGVRTQGPPV